jgi:hypothetical protein
MNIGEDKSVEKGWRGRFQGFKVSRFQGFKVSEFQGFRVSRFQGFRVSRFQSSRVSGFQGFKVSVSWRRQPRYPPFATKAKDGARRSC